MKDLRASATKQFLIYEVGRWISQPHDTSYSHASRPALQNGIHRLKTKKEDLPPKAICYLHKKVRLIDVPWDGEKMSQDSELSRRESNPGRPRFNVRSDKRKS